MSDSIEVTSCLRHRKTARYFVVYEDLQEASEEHPDQIAAFLRILEVKTNKKLIAYSELMEECAKSGRKLPPLNLWIEISYNELVYWSLNTVSRSSFQIADKEATKKFLVKSRVGKRPVRPDDPDSPKVPYKEYLLILENVQASIDKQKLPIIGEAYEQYGNVPPVIENIPLLQKTRDMLQEIYPSCYKKHIPPVKNNRYKSNKKENSKESKKESFPNVVEITTTLPTHITLTQPLEEKRTVPEAKQDDPKGLLTPEQHHWFEGIFCHGKWYVVPPRLTQTLAEHVKKLYPIIKTVDDLNSLYDFEKERLKDKPDPIVKPGNLASSDTLNAWMQTRIPVVASKPQAPARTESTGQYGMVNFGKDPRALAFFRERSAK